jgi:hypothetical protein
MSQIFRLIEEKNELVREVIGLREELRKCRLWLGYEDWKGFNYSYNDYTDKYYKTKDGKVMPFSKEYEEMDLRKEYIKLNNL